MTETDRRLKYIQIIQSVVGCLFCFSPVNPLIHYKLIFVGYDQLNSLYVLDLFAPGMYDTSYLDMQHMGARHFLFRSDSSFREIPAILYLKRITTDILE